MNTWLFTQLMSKAGAGQCAQMIANQASVRRTEENSGLRRRTNLTAHEPLKHELVDKRSIVLQPLM
ncbi:hypothetical protein AO069_17160 [Pseudomonas syringae pv. syringae PD2774]|nr:hypothetical protein AO069_17160 [Pseudomonas syringae pv. syringae PD2774]